MKRFLAFYLELPRPVRLWFLTILMAVLYVVVRYVQLGGQEGFHLGDRILVLYAVASLIIFIGFFMTRDPE